MTISNATMNTTQAPLTNPTDAPDEAELSTEDAAVEPAEFPAADAVSPELLQRIVEGALLAAGKPLTLDDLAALFGDDESGRPSKDELRAALANIAAACEGRSFELREVASGYRFQVIQDVAPWIARLWEEKPQRYSRALLETLALIAYRQPITRGDIEDIRGVAVASNIIKTLLERDWVRVVGHKDVPGRPAMYATTRRFLDYFNLQNLDDLPTLAEIRDLDSMNTELALEGIDTVMPEEQPQLNDEVSELAAAMEAVVVAQEEQEQDQAQAPITFAMLASREEQAVDAEQPFVDEQAADDETLFDSNETTDENAADDRTEGNV